MSTNTLNVRIQEKYDIEANWITKNPVLLKGEVAYSSDKNNAYKVGDGTSTWSGLTYTKGFGKVKVGEVTIESGQNNDTLTMAGGSNITITPNTETNTVTVATSAEANVINTVKVNNTALTPTNKAVNITVPTGAAASYNVDTTIAAASKSSNLPTSAAVASFVEGKGYKTTDNNTTYTLTQDSTDGHKITLTPSTGTATTITIPDNNTTYSDATTSASGLMSASDKTKLNGIATGATANTGTVTSVAVKMNNTVKGTVTSSGTIDLGTVITDVSGKQDASTAVTHTASTAVGSGTQPVYIASNGVATATTYTLGKSVPNNAVFTDTHYTTGLKVGASAAATANAAATNGNVYINALDNTTVRDSHKITGSGATTVTSDANGVITVSSTNTTYSSKAAASGGTAVSLVTTGEKYTWNNKVDKTTVSAEGIAETTATITVPAKAKAVAVQKMYGKTVKITPESGDPYLANAANESVVSVSRNIAKTDGFEFGYYYDTYGKSSYIDGIVSTAPIKVESGKTYRCAMYDKSGNYLNSVCMATFANETDKKAVRSITSKSANSITINSGENYIRIRNYGEYSTYLSSSNFVYVILEGTATAFVPYFKHTAEIPISLTSLADYGCSVPKSDGSGTLYNWIDFENGLYYHNVVSVNLGNLTYGYATWGNGKAFHCSLTSFGKAQNTAGSTVANAICGKYNVVSADVTYRHDTDKVFSIHATDTSLYIVDSSYTDESEFKKSLSGSYLVYELADSAKQVIDISDIIRPLKVEAGGTVTFVNEHNIDCDTTVKYKKEI